MAPGKRAIPGSEGGGGSDPWPPRAVLSSRLLKSAPPPAMSSAGYQAESPRADCRTRRETLLCCRRVRLRVPSRLEDQGWWLQTPRGHEMHPRFPTGGEPCGRREGRAASSCANALPSSPAHDRLRPQLGRRWATLVTVWTWLQELRSPAGLRSAANCRGCSTEAASRPSLGRGREELEILRGRLTVVEAGAAERCGEGGAVRQRPASAESVPHITSRWS